MTNAHTPSFECRRMEAMLPPFVDGDASADTVAVVEAHLARCAACRHAAAAQREVRALLVSRRAQLTEVAPEQLAAEVRRAVAAPPSAAYRPRLSAFAAAAAVVLAVLGGFSWATGRSSVLLAAQLTLDHLKCFVIDGDDHDHPLSPAAGQVTFHEHYGMNVQLPVPPDAEVARLVSVRQCLYGAGWVAHALYRVGGEAVSVFVLRDGTAAPAEVHAFGRQVEIVTRKDTTYVVVAPARLAAVAHTLGLEAE